MSKVETQTIHPLLVPSPERADYDTVDEWQTALVEWNQAQLRPKRIDFKSAKAFERADQAWVAAAEELIEQRSAREKGEQQSARDNAKRTGTPQVLRTYTDECRGGLPDCTCDRITVWIDPDGTERETSSHTY